ncbi:hypothetical protein [Pyruvatibacter sp.]|uniref:hypothetical protein n=1 Tax=Pyruvatibacter sp. TaxID=1981328 RepID=UPI003263A52F
MFKDSSDLFRLSAEHYFSGMLGKRPKLYVDKSFIGSFCANQSAITENQALAFFANSEIVAEIDPALGWTSLPVSVFEYVLDNPESDLFEVSSSASMLSDDLDLKIRIYADRYFPKLELPEDDISLLRRKNCEFFFGDNPNPMIEKSDQELGDYEIVFGDEPDEEAIPASDRYVSVKDNQPEFDQLVEQLNEIHSAFKLDHNKGEFELDNFEARTADFEAFKTQVENGFVSKPIAKNLLATLDYLSEVSVKIAKLSTAIGLAIVALKGLFGI